MPDTCKSPKNKLWKFSIHYHFDISRTAECEVTEFSAWSDCSVSCGKGLRQRDRRYRNPQRAQTKGCNRQLIYKEMCVAAVAECEGGEDSSENQPQFDTTVNEQGEGLGICRTTRWSDYSECSGKYSFINLHIFLPSSSLIYDPSLFQRI